MDKSVLLIFVDEVINQCEFALISWEYLQESLRKKGEWSPEYNSRLFYHIQSFLVAVTNISKILWPKQKKFRTRGKELRRVLKAPMNSSMRDKYFRNVFEHYDDRIEKWASTSKEKHISDMNISIDGFSAIPDLDPIDCMRNLDISRDGKNLTLTFHGDSHNLTMTEPEVRELLERAKKLRPSLWSEVKPLSIDRSN